MTWKSYRNIEQYTYRLLISMHIPKNWALRNCWHLTIGNIPSPPPPLLYLPRVTMPIIFDGLIPCTSGVKLKAFRQIRLEFITEDFWGGRAIGEFLGCMGGKEREGSSVLGSMRWSISAPRQFPPSPSLHPPLLSPLSVPFPPPPPNIYYLLPCSSTSYEVGSYFFLKKRCDLALLPPLYLKAFIYILVYSYSYI